MPKHTVTKRLAKVQRLVCTGKLDLQVGAAPEVMTAAELASFLGITMNSLCVNLWRYSIPHKRFGKRLLFTRTAIHEWITNRIEERVWIDHYKYPRMEGEFWVREAIEPPRERDPVAEDPASPQ